MVLGATTLKDELQLNPPGENRILVWLVTLGTALGVVSLYLLLRPWREEGGWAWAFSLGGSLALAAGTAFLWHYATPSPRRSRARKWRS